MSSADLKWLELVASHSACQVLWEEEAGGSRKIRVSALYQQHHAGDGTHRAAETSADNNGSLVRGPINGKDGPGRKYTATAFRPEGE